MTYLMSPEDAIKKVQELKLMEVIDNFKYQSTPQPIELSFDSPEETSRIRYILYSIFKSIGLTGKVRIKWISPTIIRLVPIVTNIGVTKVAKEVAMGISSANEMVPVDYKETDYSFVVNPDDDANVAEVTGEEDKL